jgi:hypothetical protein
MTDNINKDKIDFDKAYQSLAELLLLLNFNFDEFSQGLRQYYVLLAYEQCHTIVQTSLKTGVDRKIVRDIVQDKRPLVKPSTLSLIVQQLENLAQANKQMVNKTGQQSIHSIMQTVAPGASTVNAIVKELCERGYIEDCGNYVVYINKPKKTLTATQLQRISTHMQRYFNTFGHNINNQYAQQKKLDFTVFTTRVPAVLVQSLESSCRELLTDVTADILKILESYEQKIAYGSYDEIGICMFQFNLMQPA